MRIFQSSIPIGLGDLIFIKGQLDTFKSNFDLIKIKFHTELIEKFRDNGPGYDLFLSEIAKLFFSEAPYQITEEPLPFRSQIEICNDYGLPSTKPDLKHLLCAGDSLNIGPYIVLSTKIRYLPRTVFNQHAPELWSILRELSKKYKIVVLGERVVEMNAEYRHHTAEHIYSIYEDLIQNIPQEALVDMTIPALGISSPELSKVRQDCLILRDSEFVITFGVGGNFCMAVATANVIGYRDDDEITAERVFSKFYPDVKVTKDWNQFVSLLRNYL